MMTGTFEKEWVVFTRKRDRRRSRNRWMSSKPTKSKKSAPRSGK